MAGREEIRILDTLNALARQCNLDGQPIEPSNFEILLLANHRTNQIAAKAHDDQYVWSLVARRGRHGAG